MNPGYFKLQRRFFDHWLWSEPRPFSRAEAFLDLLQLAAFEPTKRLVSGRFIQVPRGGIVASERFLSERWKWSRTKVRHFQRMLIADRMAKEEKDRENTVLLLCNYDRWNPQKDQRGTSGEPVEDLIKEVKEGEELDTYSFRARPKPGDEDKARKLIVEFCLSEGLTAADADSCFHKWVGNGWTNGGKAIKDWRATIRSWKAAGYLPSQKNAKPTERQRDQERTGLATTAGDSLKDL